MSVRQYFITASTDMAPFFMFQNNIFCHITFWNKTELKKVFQYSINAMVFHEGQAQVWISWDGKISRRILPLWITYSLYVKNVGYIQI